MTCNGSDPIYIPSLAQACSFALTAVFFFLLVIKFGVLASSVDHLLAGQLRDSFYFDIHLVTVGMMSAILMALVLAAVMAAQQIVQAASVPTIRLQRTKAPPDLPLADGHMWHMFLSHIWSTGQDQCATIKRQLRIMLPGASVFLDVDNLKSIDALEEYVAQSSVVMIFASKGYFQSKSKRHAAYMQPPCTQTPKLPHTLANTCTSCHTQTASAKCKRPWIKRSPCASSLTRFEAARRFTRLRPSVMHTFSTRSLAAELGPNATSSLGTASKTSSSCRSSCLRNSYRSAAYGNAACWAARTAAWCFTSRASCSVKGWC